MSEQIDFTEKTYAQDFFERFPRYPMEWDGTPPICRNIVYGHHTCEHNGERKCKNCWNEVMPEVKHGHWIKDPESGETRCSECDWSLEVAWESNYCPDCGAKMYL